jgi:hypothetical protein
VRVKYFVTDGRINGADFEREAFITGAKEP